MERRIFGYGYSARRTDVAGKGRARSSNPGITGHRVAKAHYAAAGHCGGEMEPERRGSAAAGKHMSGRYSNRQWAGSVSLPGNLENYKGVIRTRSLDLRLRPHDRLLVGRKESLEIRQRVGGDGPAGIHRESACVGLGSVITTRADIVGDAEHPGRIGGPIPAAPLEVGADHQLMVNERLAL